jgi:hypothetical protein
MLKKLAVIYVILAALESYYRLSTAIELGVFDQAKPWFVWSVNIFGLIAVWAYATQHRLVSNNVWKIVLAVFVTVRVIEIFQRDLFDSNISALENLHIGIKYLWYVLPSILCLYYWSFWKRREHVNFPR